MRISELSRRSGVPVATIKYYLRENLLPKGEAVSATQSRYTEEHLKRLRLVRALVEVADVPLGRIRAVLKAVDDPDLDLHTLLGVAQYAFTQSPEAPADDDPVWQRAEHRTADLLAQLGWQAEEASPARGRLVQAVAALERLGTPPTPEMLHGYAAAAHRTAELDLDSVHPGMPRDEMVQQVVTASALMEQALSALRLLAQEDESARRFARGPWQQGRPGDGGAGGDRARE